MRNLSIEFLYPRDQGYTKAILTLYQSYIKAMLKIKNIGLI